MGTKSFWGSGELTIVSNHFFSCWQLLIWVRQEAAEVIRFLRKVEISIILSVLRSQWPARLFWKAPKTHFLLLPFYCSTDRGETKIYTTASQTWPGSAHDWIRVMRLIPQLTHRFYLLSKGKSKPKLVGDDTTRNLYIDRTILLITKEKRNQKQIYQYVDEGHISNSKQWLEDDCDYMLKKTKIDKLN